VVGWSRDLASGRLLKKAERCGEHLRAPRAAVSARPAAPAAQRTRPNLRWRPVSVRNGNSTVLFPNVSATAPRYEARAVHDGNSTAWSIWSCRRRPAVRHATAMEPERAPWNSTAPAQTST